MLKTKARVAAILAFCIDISYAGSLDLKPYLDLYQNFPKAGINYVDINSLLSNPSIFNTAMEQMTERYKNTGIQAIVAIESRGFIFGAALAQKLGLPLILARKPNKLPGVVSKYCYKKEYGSDCLEIQKKAMKDHQKILVIDDIYATGGTIQAVVNLLERNGIKHIELAVIGKVNNIPGQTMPSYPLYSLVEFD